MWVLGTWKTEEDVLNDILLLDEYREPRSSSCKVPDTIRRYRKQMAENKKRPLNSSIDENISYIISGRGKGIKDRVLRPGEGIESHPFDVVTLKNEIKQVSKLGYSNELIEASIRANFFDPDETSNDSSLKLVPISSARFRSSSNQQTARGRLPLKIDSGKRF